MGVASSQLVRGDSFFWARASRVSALTRTCRAGASANATRQRRWAASSSGACANQRASELKSAARSARWERRSLIWVTAVSNAGIAVRARARSSSAWEGAPTPMNQRRRPAQRCCQRISAAANPSGVGSRHRQVRGGPQLRKRDSLRLTRAGTELRQCDSLRPRVHR
jgi:hypothetical protein